MVSPSHCKHSMLALLADLYRHRRDGVTVCTATLTRGGPARTESVCVSQVTRTGQSTAHINRQSVRPFRQLGDPQGLTGGSWVRWGRSPNGVYFNASSERRRPDFELNCHGLFGQAYENLHARLFVELWLKCQKKYLCVVAVLGWDATFICVLNSVNLANSSHFSSNMSKQNQC